MPDYPGRKWDGEQSSTLAKNRFEHNFAALPQSGMSPQLVGINQVNILVGQTTPTGNAQAIVIEIGGASINNHVNVAVE